MQQAATIMLKDAFERQLRSRIRRDETRHEKVEECGRLYRSFSPDGGHVTHRNLADMPLGQLEDAVARQRDFFAERGLPFEWRLYADDCAQLPALLLAAGFTAVSRETVMVGDAMDAAVAPRLLAGAQLRQVDTSVDLERVQVMHRHAHVENLSRFLAEMSESVPPAPGADSRVVVVAEINEELASCGVVRFCSGTDFASLSVGVTLPKWQGLGLYRAVASRCAAMALGRGHKYVHGVCPDDETTAALSGLGMVPIATTLTYRWAPASR